MIVKDNRFITPPWNMVIWRYMTFEKFLDIILNNRLFFSNVGKMTDKTEATIPKKNAERLEKKIRSSQPDEFKALMEFSNVEENFKIQKLASFINCWIMNRFESYALWKIYLSGNKSGIAIRTNIKYLTDSINSISQKRNDNIYIGKVNYTDFITEPLDISKLITNKGLYYQFENEVRLIILTEPEFYAGEKTQQIFDSIRISVNPKTLIQDIYISPFISKPLQNVIKQTIIGIDNFYRDRIRISAINDS